MVLIGVDPHKGSHTAVVVDDDEHELGRLKVRADRRQLERMLTVAAPFGERTWAIESAGGLGFLLAQQLVAAGEDAGWTTWRVGITRNLIRRNLARSLTILRTKRARWRSPPSSTSA
jgi:hypothetical protein